MANVANNVMGGADECVAKRGISVFGTSLLFIIDGLEIRACLKNRKHRLFALSGRICVSKILVIRKYYLRFSSSNRTGQGKNPALSLFSNKP